MSAKPDPPNDGDIDRLHAMIAELRGQLKGVRDVLGSAVGRLSPGAQALLDGDLHARVRALKAEAEQVGGLTGRSFYVVALASQIATIEALGRSRK